MNSNIANIGVINIGVRSFILTFSCIPACSLLSRKYRGQVFYLNIFLHPFLFFTILSPWPVRSVSNIPAPSTTSPPVGMPGRRYSETIRTEHIFFDLLGKAVARYHWICHAYCLMDNHYHLVVETPEGSLSRGMKNLNGVCTKKYKIKDLTPAYSLALDNCSEH